jgi:cell division protease FtsH
MRATELARRMVAEFGMSEKLGSVRYAGQQLQYLGKSVEDNSQISPQTREIIDQEVQRLVMEQYDRARELLKRQHDSLKALAQHLLERETVDGSVIKEALANASAAYSGAEAGGNERAAAISGGASLRDNTGSSLKEGPRMAATSPPPNTPNLVAHSCSCLSADS